MYNLKSLYKFNIDKKYKYFPGLSIIKTFDDEELIRQIITIKKEMENFKYFQKFVFLPEDSYHMTVCDLVTFNDLNTNINYKDFPLKDETDYDLIDKYVFNTLQNEEFGLDVKMKPIKITSTKIMLSPKTEEDRLTLDNFRKKVYDKLNLLFNESYKFHISLTYKLIELSENEKNELGLYLDTLNKKYLDKISDIKIDIANLVVFNDMSEFRKLSKGRENLGRYKKDL